MESSSSELKEILKSNPELQKLVPEKNPCKSVVAFIGERAVGLAVGFEQDETELFVSHIFVTNVYRRTSVGTRLISLLEKLALERRYNRLSLHVVGSNIQAKKLYEKLGFVKRRIYARSLELWTKNLN